jgi:sulfur carrier protein ThiS
VQITFKLFASLQDYLPAAARKTNDLAVELAEGTTVQQVIERFGLPQQSCHLVLIDGHFVPASARNNCILKNGNTLAIWPPIAGG